MNLWLKFCIVFGLFIELYDCKNKINKKDLCDVRKFEENIHTIFPVYEEKGKWPENDDQMEVWCKSVQKSHKFLKSYSESCLQGLSRPTISVLNYNAGKANQYFCRNKEERKRFIDKGVCGNRGKNEGIKCWNKILSRVEVVKNITDHKEKLSSLCCVFYFLKECVYNVYKKLHPRYCSEDNLKHVDLHLDKVAMDSFSIICSEYENQDKCEGYRIKIDKLDKTDIVPRYKTPFPVMFEILETI